MKKSQSPKVTHSTGPLIYSCNDNIIQKRLVVFRLKGVERKQMWLCKRNMRNPCDDGNVLYLGCFLINVLDGILSIRFCNVTDEGNWVKGTWELSVLFHKIVCKSVIFSKKKSNFKNVKKKTNCQIILQDLCII